MILIATKTDLNRGGKKKAIKTLDFDDFSIPMSMFTKVDSAWYVEGDRVQCLKDRRPKESGGFPKGEVKLGPIARQTVRFFANLVGNI